ncbi:Aste57867_8119 [Aphanomyces stellatus]|uniref:Inositol-tetrakisphosphate 1-kinase n=1 Tax=Aphanomyces stellatus TaxID=120398 RepID=A0A485KJG3_9STRA|nr:hypothetical protein As57867_008089 [Aphanomyces stellatus]VFT85008.1 Aste57867_8119 [Aphanomyces stellatus]
MAAPLPVLRVGVILPLKKTRNGRMQELLRSQELGIHFIHIDLETVQSVEDMVAACGRLDAILHKLAHDMVFEPLGDATAAKNMRIMHEYMKQYPNVPLIDPLDNVRVLTNREAVCQMLTDVPRSTFSIPLHAIVNSAESKAAFLARIKSGDFPLPVLAKSIEACGTDASHRMQVLSTTEDIQSMDPSVPILFQEFVNHGGRLFKGYVLGETILIAERNSLPDLHESTTIKVEFDTQRPFPTAAAFDQAAVAQPAQWTAPLEAQIRDIGCAIQAQAKLTLFGYDVIVSSKTRQLMVVDVNYFPSYKELESFDPLLRQHIRKLVQ